MASIVGHFAAGYTVSKFINWKSGLALILFATGSAFLPDIDVVGFRLGIKYGDFFGHRGFTHSIVFAALWAGATCFFFKDKRITAFLIIFLATASHGLLDGMTTGGFGVAYFAPFDNARYFLPWRPIKVSPIGISKFFGKWGLLVLQSELIFVILPCALLLLGKKVIQRFIN